MWSGRPVLAADALRVLQDASPAVVLLDVDLGAERAIDFVLGARKAGYEGHVVAVTAGMSDAEAIQLVQAGVTGIVHKHHSIGILRDAILLVAKGEVSIENSYLVPVLRSMDRTRRPKTPMLTPRDKAVVGSVLQGLTNREMAEKLGISEGAVKALHAPCLREAGSADTQSAREGRARAVQGPALVGEIVDEVIHRDPVRE